MPIFSYFFVVGLILVDLLYCADAVIVPSRLSLVARKSSDSQHPTRRRLLLTFQEHTGTDVEAIGRREVSADVRYWPLADI